MMMLLILSPLLVLNLSWAVSVLFLSPQLVLFCCFLLGMECHLLMLLKSAGYDATKMLDFLLFSQGLCRCYTSDGAADFHTVLGIVLED